MIAGLLLLAALSGRADAGCLTGLPPLRANAVRALLRHEETASRRLGPVARARILERQGRLLGDADTAGHGGRCYRAWLARTRRALLGPDGVVFTRETVALLRALVSPPGAGPGDPETVQLFAAVLTGTVTPYRPLDEEPGVATPGLLRAIAALGLARQGPAARPGTPAAALVARRVSESDDALELLALQAALDGPPEGLDPGRWAADLDRRLLGPPDPVVVELVIARLYGLAHRADADGLALARDIVARGGVYPLTAANDGAQRDLHRAALTVLYTEARPAVRVAAQERVVERVPFDLEGALLTREPAGGPVGPDAEEDVAARLGWLDRTYHRALDTQVRCAILDELPRWAPPEDAAERWDALAEAIVLDGRLAGDREAACRLRALLAFDQLPVAPRVALALRVLDTPLGPALPRRAGIAEGLGGVPVALAAADGLRRHPAWLAVDPALRAWLAARALADDLDPGDYTRGRVEMDVRAAVHPLIAFHLSGAPDADPAVATALLRRSLTRIDRLLGSTISNLAALTELSLHLAALERWADAAGLPEADERFAFIARDEWTLKLVNAALTEDLRRQAWVALRRPRR